MTEIIKTARKKPTKDRDMTKLTNKHKAVFHEDLSPEQARDRIRKLQIKKNNTGPDYEPMFVWEEYQNMRSLKRIPINNIWIDALAKEIVKWIDDDVDAIRFDEFLQKKAMLETEFRRLAAKSTILRKAWEYALRGIARNRELGAWKRGKNWSVAQYNLAYYCDITKGESERRAKLKDEMSTELATKVVVIPSVEEFEKEIAKEREKE